MKLDSNEIFGFVKPYVDVHTLGITTISNLLKDCGYQTYIAPPEISKAVVNIQKVNNFSILQKWLSDRTHVN